LVAQTPIPTSCTEVRLFILKMESIILPSAIVTRMRLAAIPVQKPNNG
jgi:hypothetical protein